MTIWQLVYGTAADAWDEYLMMSERTTRECLYKFSKCVVKLYSKEYLRKPNSSEIQQLYRFHHQKHGFPGMLESIDCMHWPWRNCHNAWRGMFTRGEQGHPSIILETVCSQDLWVWHAFFGISGSTNDINVINQSEIFSDVIKGTSPDTIFTVLGVEYRCVYYLADRIYTPYSTVVETILHRFGEKRKKFAKYQEAARKDVEHLFGVQQANWHIIENPARAFTPKKLRYCMYACILLHNMILEDEDAPTCEYDENSSTENDVPVDPHQQDLNEFSLHNEFTHQNLQADLVEYIWNNGQD